MKKLKVKMKKVNILKFWWHMHMHMPVPVLDIYKARMNGQEMRGCEWDIDAERQEEERMERKEYKEI
jgi:hypothetical protein